MAFPAISCRFGNSRMLPRLAFACSLVGISLFGRIAANGADGGERFADQQIPLPKLVAAPRRTLAPDRPPAIHVDAAAADRWATPHAEFGGVQQASFACDCDDCRLGAGSLADPMCGLEPTCAAPARRVAEPLCGTEFEFGAGHWLGARSPLHGCDGTGCDALGCDACCGDGVRFGSRPFQVQWQLFELFAGVQGFTGPSNHPGSGNVRGGSGSFGFYEGFNRGQSLHRVTHTDLAYQFGARAAQSNLSGAEFTDDVRRQIFVTGGLFRRVDFGLQYGLVVDYLYDDWWYRNNLVQLRGELSWNDARGHEFGYQFMAGTKESTSDVHWLDGGNEIQGTRGFRVTDQHRLFFRGRAAQGGMYHLFAGGTGVGEGLLGGGLTSPVRGLFALQAGATYVIPGTSRSAGGYAEEAWNLSMGFVFYPGGRGGQGRYGRPLFDVADNGTFLVRPE